MGRTPEQRLAIIRAGHAKMLELANEQRQRATESYDRVCELEQQLADARDAYADERLRLQQVNAKRERLWSMLQRAAEERAA